MRAHRDVRDEALVVACERLQRLLRHARPEVARNLAAARVEVHVIGERQVLSDLPGAILKLNGSHADLNKANVHAPRGERLSFVRGVAAASQRPRRR